MSIEALQRVDQWIVAAVAALGADAPGHEFLRRKLLELRLRISEIAGSSAAGQPVSADSVKQAIERAVTALRAQPSRLNAAETIILSKLLVIQSQLCTPRFDGLA